MAVVAEPERGMWQMGTWERTVAREMAPAFAAGFCLFLLAMLTGQLVKLGDASLLWASGGLGGAVALEALAYALPPLVGVLLPMAWLFACLFALSRQSEERELLALAQAGRSPATLYRVPLWGGAMVALLACGALVFGEPWGARHLRALFAERARQALTEQLLPRTFYQWVPGVTVYVEDKRGDLLRGILLCDRRHEQRPLVVDAECGRIEVAGTGADTTATLSLERGRSLSTRAGDGARVVAFARGRYRLDLGAIHGKPRLSITAAQEQSLSELYRHSRALSHQGGPEALSSITLQRKFSFPAAAIVFAAVAVGLAAGISRGARGKSVFASAALIAGYYALGRSLELLARAGTLTPLAAAWLPNGLGVSLAVALGLLRARRRA